LKIFKKKFLKKNFLIFFGKGHPLWGPFEGHPLWGPFGDKIFFYQFMTIHTPIESPGRIDKNYAVFKLINGVILPKKAKNRVKMLKNRLFEVEKKSEKNVKTQMRPTFFRDLHLISQFKYEKKNMDFFHRVQWTHLTMVRCVHRLVPKTTPKELLSLIQIKKISP
jgi:hypothetical protein